MLRQCSTGRKAKECSLTSFQEGCGRMKKKSTRLLPYEQKRVLCSAFSSIVRGETVLMLSTCARFTVAGMNTGLDGRDRSGGGTLHGCRDETAGRRTRLSLKSKSKGIRRRRQTERLQHARMPFFISQAFLGERERGFFGSQRTFSRICPVPFPQLRQPCSRRRHMPFYFPHSFLGRAREGALWLAKNPLSHFLFFFFPAFSFPFTSRPPAHPAPGQ